MSHKQDAVQPHLPPQPRMLEPLPGLALVFGHAQGCYRQSSELARCIRYYFGLLRWLYKEKEKSCPRPEHIKPLPILLLLLSLPLPLPLQLLLLQQLISIYPPPSPPHRRRSRIQDLLPESAGGRPGPGSWLVGGDRPDAAGLEIANTVAIHVTTSTITSSVTTNSF